MNKKQVQEAITRIDNALAQLNTNRQGHIILTNDIHLIQTVCMDYFDDMIEAETIPIRPEKEDERTDKSVDDVEPGDEDSEGSGDGV